MLEQAFEILEERAVRLGRDFKNFWFVSAASGLVQSKLAPEHAAFFRDQTTDRVAKLFHKILAFQTPINLLGSESHGYENPQTDLLPVRYQGNLFHVFNWVIY